MIGLISGAARAGYAFLIMIHHLGCAHGGSESDGDVVRLPAFMLIKVLAPAFYSRKDPRTPVRIAVISRRPTSFQPGHRDSDGAPGGARPHAGLALATSIAAYVNAGLLFGFCTKTDFPAARRMAEISPQIGSPPS
jgi:hypothetical protein